MTNAVRMACAVVLCSGLSLTPWFAAQAQPPAAPQPAQPAQPQPPVAQPLVLRHKATTNVTTKWRMRSTTSASAIVPNERGDGTDTLTATVEASTVFTARCTAAAATGETFDLSFTLEQIAFNYRDNLDGGEVSFDIGVDGKMRTRVNGHADQQIPELDFWATPADWQNTLPPTMGKELATAVLSPRGGLSKAVAKLPTETTGSSSKTLLTFTNPGELAAMVYLPLPAASLTGADAKSTWTAAVPVPKGWAGQTTTLNLACEVVGAAPYDEKNIEVKFQADSGSLDKGVTVSGRFAFDAATGTVKSVTYRVAVKGDGIEQSTETTFTPEP